MYPAVRLLPRLLRSLLPVSTSNCSWRALSSASPQLSSASPSDSSSTKRLPKIYTKTGDKGTSALYTGERRSKQDDVFQALGAVDELSCHVGVAREVCLAHQVDHPFTAQLHRVQCVLQDVGSSVATPLSTARPAHLARVQFSEAHTKELEDWIDSYTASLPPLENFVLPGGGVTAAHVHVARAVCRRAERCVVTLVAGGDCEPEAARYLNRLSDYLFTVARVAVVVEGGEETIYTRPQG